MSPRQTFNTFIHDKFNQGNFFFHAFESLDINGKSSVLITLLYDLINDNNEMPNALCGMLNMPINSTYSEAAMKIIAEFGY